MTEHEVRIERTMTAPPEVVWAAWTDAGTLSRWYCPNPDLALTVTADVVVGGRYRVDMGEGRYVAEGTYTELAAGRVVAFTWQWTTEPGPPTEVRVELTPTADGGTHLLLVQTGLADADDAAGHGEGWELSLGRLSGVLADEGASPAAGARNG